MNNLYPESLNHYPLNNDNGRIIFFFPAEMYELRICDSSDTLRENFTDCHNITDDILLHNATLYTPQEAHRHEEVVVDATLLTATFGRNAFYHGCAMLYWGNTDLLTITCSYLYSMKDNTNIYIYIVGTVICYTKWRSVLSLERQ